MMTRPIEAMDKWRRSVVADLILPLPEYKSGLLWSIVVRFIGLD